MCAHCLRKHLPVHLCQKTRAHKQKTKKIAEYCTVSLLLRRFHVYFIGIGSREGETVGHPSQFHMPLELEFTQNAATLIFKEA